MVKFMNSILWSLGLLLAMMAPADAANTYAFGFSEVEACPNCTVQLRLSTDMGLVTLSTYTRGVLVSPGQSIGASQTQPYYVGLCSPPECAQPREYRNWFLFVMYTGTYSTITNAVLLITVPSGNSVSLPGYSGAYTLHGISRGTEFDFMAGGTQTTSFSELGNGPTYSSVAISSNDEGTVIEMPLTGQAVAYLEAALAQYDPLTNQFPPAVLGGALTVSAIQIPIPALSWLSQLLLAILILIISITAGKWMFLRGGARSSSGVIQ